MKGIWYAIPLAAVGIAGWGLKDGPSMATIGSFATPLEGRTSSQRHNALLAIQKLNDTRIEPGDLFSFNKCVGTFSKDAGYRKAPVSYNGTLIDDWGGGVCQASTTLYNAALLSGMDIVERHRHQFQPSYVSAGRDAAVAFSNIDLRFRNPYPFAIRLKAEIAGQALRISIVAPHALPVRPQVYSELLSTKEPWTFHVQGSRAKVRNTGKVGWQVAVYRVTGNRRELVSEDTYPVMHRVVQEADH